MSKDGFNANDIDGIVARCSKRRPIDNTNLKRKTLETGALPSATHDAGVAVLSCAASVLSESTQQSRRNGRLKKEWEEQERIRLDNYYYYDV